MKFTNNFKKLIQIYKFFQSCSLDLFLKNIFKY